MNSIETDFPLFWKPFPEANALVIFNLLKMVLTVLQTASGFEYKFEISLKESIFGIIARVVIYWYSYV